VLSVALGMVVATDAGVLSGLAWGVTGLAVVLLASGIAARSSVPLVAEFGTRSIELANVGSVEPGAITARLGATVAVAAVGACGAAGAALAVTAAPGRSVALTAVGAAAAVAVRGAIALLARRRYPSR
jgi:hypothetical protein